MLSARLDMPWRDLDNMVAAAFGLPDAAEAWKRHGERGFRAAEVSCLRLALAEPGGVIALGGGTPTIPAATSSLRAAQDAGTAVLVYLRASPGTLRSRMLADTSTCRPSLTGTLPEDEVESIFLKRDSLYRKIADHVAVSDSLTPGELVAQVSSAYRQDVGAEASHRPA